MIFLRENSYVCVMKYGWHLFCACVKNMRTRHLLNNRTYNVLSGLSFPVCVSHIFLSLHKVK